MTASAFRDPLDRKRFGLDPWALREVFEPAANRGQDSLSATLFALANGYLGVRGDGDGTRGLGHGTFVNGFHETFAIKHAEDAYGLARCGQVIQGVPDLAGFSVSVDGVPLQHPDAVCVDASQELDFRRGTGELRSRWRLADGRSVEVRQRRLVSLANRHLAMFECTVTVAEGGQVTISQLLADRDQTPADPGVAMDPRRAERVEDAGLDECGVWQEPGLELRAYRCRHSRRQVVLGCAVLGRVGGRRQPGTGRTVTASLRAGQSLEVTTFAAYHACHADPLGVTDPPVAIAGDLAALRDACRQTLVTAVEAGAARVYAAQRDWLADFWKHSDIRITTTRGREATQQAVRWTLFQLAQASAQAAGQGIGAKGLSGSGYSGHYFWDTEIYVLPFLAYTNPPAARALLEFRHAMLPAARSRAATLDVAGALFPWRTINGEEASAYYPAGTAQFHIDADIAFATSQYVAVTGDRDFMTARGIDLLVETARMWLSLGFWQTDGDEKFHLHGVTGPDEYTAVVDDNLFTNVMARFNLRRAAETFAELGASDPPAHAAAIARLGVEPHEPGRWVAAADGMFIPWDDDRGIHPQDAHFLSRRRWDDAGTPQWRQPLLLHHHSLVIYRHQVLKQADVVLALLLRSNEFTAAQKRADFDYYDPLTTGDSTLSAVSQAVIAAEVGHRAAALEHFERALFIDLADRHGNTSDGVHLASAGGIWSVLTYGFGGLRDSGEEPSLDPRLPPEWDALDFVLTIRGSCLAVRLEHTSLTLSLIEGEALEITVRGQPVGVRPDCPTRIPLE